jgi:hypothetical protein
MPQARTLTLWLELSLLSSSIENIDRTILGLFTGIPSLLNRYSAWTAINTLPPEVGPPITGNVCFSDYAGLLGL